MVDQCLVKDPAGRPSAAELLSSPFFRTVKKKSHLVGTVLSEETSHSKFSPLILVNRLINLIRIATATHSATRET